MHKKLPFLSHFLPMNFNLWLLDNLYTLLTHSLLASAFGWKVVFCQTLSPYFHNNGNPEWGSSSSLWTRSNKNETCPNSWYALYVLPWAQTGFCLPRRTLQNLSFNQILWKHWLQGYCSNFVDKTKLLRDRDRQRSFVKTDTMEQGCQVTSS